jgi:hypothetical protein
LQAPRQATLGRRTNQNSRLTGNVPRPPRQAPRRQTQSTFDRRAACGVRSTVCHVRHRPPAHRSKKNDSFPDVRAASGKSCLSSPEALYVCWRPQEEVPASFVSHRAAAAAAQRRPHLPAPATDSKNHSQADGAGRLCPRPPTARLRRGDWRWPQRFRRRSTFGAECRRVLRSIAQGARDKLRLEAERSARRLGRP